MDDQREPRPPWRALAGHMAAAIAAARDDGVGAMPAALREDAILPIGALRDVGPGGRGPGEPLPALGHLPDLLSHLGTDHPARSCLGQTAWTTYKEDAWSRPFRDRQASGEVIGPAGIRRGAGASLGLMVMSPGTTYPPHAHALHEAYLVLAGGATWTVGRADLEREAGPGAVVHTPPGTVHAIRTKGDALLCAYLWWDDPTGATYRHRPDPWSGERKIVERMVG